MRKGKIQKDASRQGKRPARKKPLHTRSTFSRKITAAMHQDLRLLAQQIGNIIPATSMRKGGFCFESLSKKYGLGKFWPKEGNKKERIIVLLTRAYRNHPRLFYKVFRENLAKGIERRHLQGNPVLKQEVQGLDKTLLRLCVNLSQEMRSLNLPEKRPSVVPPPQEFRQMLEKVGLHSYLLPSCVELFKGGYLNESIRRALEKYETFVQAKSGLQEQGVSLMASVFGPQDFKIVIADTATKRGKGLQEGFKFISMGAMGFWRNYTSHGDEEQIPHQDAFAVLLTVSHLLYYIEQNRASPN